MYKRLPAHQINKAAWDACVHQDPAGLVYALSWYLDIVAPAWEGIAATEGESYKLVMPLPKRRIAGRPVISQPVFLQQSGIFGGNTSKKEATIAALLPLAFSAASPVEHYSFNSENYNQVSALLPLQKRLNYVLPLSQSYSDIYQKYDTNRLRDLKKAGKAGLFFMEGKEVEPALLDLLRQYLVSRLEKKQQASVLKTMRALITEVQGRGLGRIVVVCLPNKQIVAGAFFIQFKNRLIYLLPATCPTGKKVGANTFLLDQICRQAVGSNLILDLEGSSLPGVARFYQSLGAQTETYGLLVHYKYPFWLKQLSALRNWWSGFRP